MQEKKVFISQSNYIPWKGYFDAINWADIFVIYDEMQYTKNDWRNRNKIKTPQGAKWLTIPVRTSNNFGQKINETRTVNSSWRIKHWRSIEQNYSKSKYFKEFSKEFGPLYLNSSEENISQINFKFIEKISTILGIKVEFLWSASFNLKGNKSERLLNICKELDAKIYLSGPAAKNYLNVDLFDSNNIRVKWLDYSEYPEYPQLHGPFEHGVSIIDLLFNAGYEASQYMKSFTE